MNKNEINHYHINITKNLLKKVIKKITALKNKIR